MTLRDLSVGEIGIVTKVNITEPMKSRLADMGILRGAEIAFCKRAPLGGLTEIEVMDCRVAIRDENAENIEIERLKE